MLFHLKKLLKEEKTKKINTIKEIIKIRVKIHEIENRKTREKSIKPKVGSLKKVNKIRSKN